VSAVAARPSTLIELAAAIAERRISSREVVESHLRRIEAVNPRLNAVVTLAEDALERADAADAELARGASRGPLHGVPITLKDSIDTAGLRTTAGTVGWRERIPGRDATVAHRLKAAGAIVVGSALIVEVKYQPPYWLHAVLWLPLMLLVILWPLRAMKSLLIALQFHHKAAEGRLIEKTPK